MDIKPACCEQQYNRRVMLKKMFRILVAWVFLLGLAGQAVAYFKDGNPTGGVVLGTPSNAVLATAESTGSLKVTILPQEAVTAGAKWRRGSSHFPGFPWYTSGATETGVPTGEWSVAFSDVTGWNKPDLQWVTVNNGQTATATGTYTRQTGSLTVTITPQAAVDAGAKWRRAGTNIWKNSGSTETGVFVGPHS
jgi:hypothetical protein